MGKFKYSLELSKEERKKCALAQFHDVDASYKDLTQVCRAIKGKSIANARKVLDDAIARKRAVPYKKFCKQTAHRSELGGKKGRYPIKECRLVRDLLDNAVANALQKGLSEEKLFVKHACAFKQNVFPRYRRYWAGGAILGYGRQAVWSNYVTARMEIVLCEKEASGDAHKKKQ